MNNASLIIPGIIIVALGIMAILITYIFAPLASKKSGHHVSGIPGVGGILVIVGFLLTPWKWLALIGAIEAVYILICIAPDIIGLIKGYINWAPPSGLEGEPIAFTSYKNRYDEIRTKDLPDGGYELREIVRYVITKTDKDYKLYGLDMASRTVICVSYHSEEECRNSVPPSARKRWKKTA
ncbi:MAG: hypothetical protein IJ757_06995 [Clostridiales bacterium]|nr:hypothetical protein [Clostridiales bacterium]